MPCLQLGLPFPCLSYLYIFYIFLPPFPSVLCLLSFLFIYSQFDFNFAFIDFITFALCACRSFSISPAHFPIYSSLSSLLYSALLLPFPFLLLRYLTPTVLYSALLLFIPFHFASFHLLQCISPAAFSSFPFHFPLFLSLSLTTLHVSLLPFPLLCSAFSAASCLATSC